MPVTKTAKRALRGSKRKESINKSLISRLEIAIRHAYKTKKEDDVKKAVSITDRAQKKGVIHKNKAARIKSKLSKQISAKKSSPKATYSKKPSKK